MSAGRSIRVVAMTLVAVVGCGGLSRENDADDERRAGFGGFAKDAVAPANEVAQSSLARAPAPANPAGPSEAQVVRLPNQMIIRSGQVTIEVDSLEPAVRQVTSVAGRFGGVIASSSVSAGKNEPRTATVDLRIPTARYDTAVDALREIGEVRTASTSSQDVGEEFVDVTARVANARRLEERLLTVLRTQTGKLSDVLNVERELARVREEIERYQGRLRYLEAQVSMSTLSVTVFEPGPVVGDPGANPIVAAFREAARNFVGVLSGAIAIAGGLLPIVALVGLGLLAARPWLRRAKAPPSAM